MNKFCKCFFLHILLSHVQYEWSIVPSIIEASLRFVSNYMTTKIGNNIENKIYLSNLSAYEQTVLMQQICTRNRKQEKKALDSNV